ncbi:MAG: DNA repair protein RadA [Proteobacteria bacterium]|nr:DNA repair protein RadA [Pseudomonadota bacterium]
MAAAKSVFVCSDCGGQSAKWLGRCPQCGAWNSLIETVPAAAPRAGVRTGTGATSARHAALAPASTVQSLRTVPAKAQPHLPTGIAELDRVLGGGLVAGSVVLIGGDPGIGKSTLLLQVLAHLSTPGAAAMQHAAADARVPALGPSHDAGGQRERVLYVSGEESAAQVALRAQRLGLKDHDVRLMAEIQLERIIGALGAEQPDVCVIDSIQTVYTEMLTSAPGSVAQVRECAAQLTRMAKSGGTCIVLVGHVTKEGALAGPRVLEHMVDTVLYFEGDTHSSYRLIRAIKNRFGAVNELGVFAMTERGLKGVSNPSALFLSHHGAPVAGSCVLATLEGTRPLLVEVQALADTAASPSPRRLSVGLEPARLAMLLAVLHRHAGIACGDQDVFVNAVGGVRITEPAADLAVLLAIQSSLKNRPLPRGLLAFGEVGLAGEIRPAPRGQERLREAAKLGFSAAIIPAANAPKTGGARFEGLALHPVHRIDEALDVVRSLQG